MTITMYEYKEKVEDGVQKRFDELNSKIDVLIQENKDLKAFMVEMFPKKVDSRLIRRVVEAYKLLVGVPADDKAWDKVYYPRFTRYAKELILFFGGDFKQICDCMEWVKKECEYGKLDYNLGTIVKRMDGYKYPKEKRNG